MDIGLVEDDFTTEELMEIINVFKADGLHEMCDASAFSAFYAEMKIEDTLFAEMTHVEFEWLLEIHQGHSHYTDLRLNFSGINEERGKWGPNKENMRFGLDFSPLGAWKHLPIRLSNKMEVHRISKEKWDIEEISAPSYNLLDMIFWFLNDIAFSGTPEARQAQAEEIKCLAREIDRGEVELLSAEEAKEQVLKGIQNIKDS